MTTVSDLLAVIDDFAPFANAADWDPVGLQIGGGEWPVRRVAVCHEVTTAAVAAAVEAEADAVVAYHPLLFHPVTSLLAGPTPTGRALDLAAAGVALVVTHTAFDVAAGGTADALASTLGCSDIRPFAMIDAGDPADDSGPALGRVGDVAPRPLSELVDAVAGALAAPAIRYAGDAGEVVRTLAVLPGSGGDFIAEAAAAGADVLLTGDVSHHRAVEALARGVMIIDAGHAPTERPGMAALLQAVALSVGGLPGVEVVDLTALPTDPWGR